MCFGSPVRCALVLALAATPLTAQATDTTHVDSTQVDSASPGIPLFTSPQQQQFLEGLRRVRRGIAQLRVAAGQSTRAQAATDTTTRRRAAGRMGGFCISARSFMTGGRARMQPMAFEDTTRVKARRLVQRVDEIITYTKTCETQAAAAPAQVAGEIVKRIQSFEEALAEFRTAVGLANN